MFAPKAAAIDDEDSFDADEAVSALIQKPATAAATATRYL